MSEELNGKGKQRPIIRMLEVFVAAILARSRRFMVRLNAWSSYFYSRSYRYNV